MKTYVPDRSGFTGKTAKVTSDANVAGPADEGTASWPQRFLAVGTVVTVVLVVADAYSIRKQRDALDLRSKSALEAANNRVNELVDELHGTSQRLNSAEQQAISVRTDLDSAKAELAQAKGLAETFKRQQGEELIDLAKALEIDPALGRQLVDRALLLCGKASEFRQQAEGWRARLPQAAQIPGDCLITILAHRRDDDWDIWDVSLLNANGQHLGGLSRIDFEAYDGDVRLHAISCAEQLRAFDERSIVVLLDRSASTTGPANVAMREAAGMLVRRLANPSRIKVFQFGDEVQSLSPWSIDPALHVQAIDAIRPFGGTALYKGLRIAVDELRQTSGLKAAIVFTDGSDSTKSESLDSVIAYCRNAAVPVSIVALQTRETNERVLRQITSMTGGTLHSTSDAAGLSAEFGRLAASFERPVYRLRVWNPDARPLTLRVGSLPTLKLTATTVR